MNILLIVRTEIISIFILIFFIIYNKVCSRYREGKDYFNGFAICGLGHTVFALITEITINAENPVNGWNNFFHLLFFTFALLCSLKYFEYSLSLILTKNDLKKFTKLGYTSLIICILIMLFTPITYLQANGTRYSSGGGAAVSYILVFLLLLSSDAIIIIYRKRISSHTVWLLIPISIIKLCLLGIQIIIPEFLFSSAALTITVVGMFFAVENPIGKVQSRAFIDADTQMWNRNCYDYDMSRSIAELRKDSDIIYLLADINGLKIVNDTLGHLQGDLLIKICANALMKSMTHAYRVYRIGGDEFVAIYVGATALEVNNDIETAHRYCAEKAKGHDFKIAMSMGYSKCKKDEDISNAVKRADKRMYEEKDKYYITNQINRRKA